MEFHTFFGRKDRRRPKERKFNTKERDKDGK